MTFLLMQVTVNCQMGRKPLCRFMIFFFDVTSNIELYINTNYVNLHNGQCIGHIPQ